MWSKRGVNNYLAIGGASCISGGLPTMVDGSAGLSAKVMDPKNTLLKGMESSHLSYLDGQSGHCSCSGWCALF